MVTHKYSVGDKVLVLSDPDRMRDFDVGINDDMLAKCGTVVTIESRTNWRNSYITYHIEEDRWTWDEGMFEGSFTEYDMCDVDISDFNPGSII